MHQAFDGGGFVREDAVPLGERPVCGDREHAALVPGRDEFEQHACFGLVLPDAGEVVEDHEVEPVAPRHQVFRRQFAACHLEALHQVGGSGERHPAAVLRQRRPDRRGDV